MMHLKYKAGPWGPKRDQNVPEISRNRINERVGVIIGGTTGGLKGKGWFDGNGHGAIISMESHG